jgi:riboflavin transporter FmnP
MKEPYQESNDEMSLNNEEIEKKSRMSRTANITLQLVGAALFGALSLVFSAFVTPIIPRLPFGIAFFDPVSILWITCFLFFGTKSGILCCFIGTAGLIPFDPFTPIGPLMKLAATLSLIIVPIIWLKLYKSVEGVKNSQKIKNVKNYIITGSFGTLLRICIMIICNSLLFMTLYSPFLLSTNLGFIGLPGISGWTAVIITVILINAETSLWDLLVPYLLVFGTKLDEKFEIW